MLGKEFPECRKLLYLRHPPAKDWWHHGQQWERSEWDVELLNHGVFRLVETEREWLLEGYYD